MMIILDAITSLIAIVAVFAFVVVASCVFGGGLVVLFVMLLLLVCDGTMMINTALPVSTRELVPGVGFLLRTWRLAARSATGDGDGHSDVFVYNFYCPKFAAKAQRTVIDSIAFRSR